jgi:hypothetical protein
MIEKIYILNFSGGHGHFLTFVLDKLCKDTPDIKNNPFDNLGNSHNFYQQSGIFNFVDAPQVEEFVKKSHNKNLILITIDNELLYYERVWLSRAGNLETDLDSEDSISYALKKNGSTFPDYCKENSMSIKDGYKFGFKFLDQNGVIKSDNNRKKILELKNNNASFFPISNFLSLESFQFGLSNISEKFAIELDFVNLKEIYDQFYKKNKILQSHNNVNLHLKGDNTIKLDIIQQAYVDSLVL